MTKLTARQQGALETKNILFETALALFSEHGFDKVTVDDITTAAGYSKGTFYNHFPAKEYVFLEYFNRIDEFYDATFEKISEDISATEQFFLLVETMARYCAHHYGLDALTVIYGYELTKQEEDPFLGNRDRNLFRQLRRILELGRERGEFNTERDVDSTINFIERNLHGLIYDWCMYKGSFDLVEETRFHFRYLLKAIKV